MKLDTIVIVGAGQAGLQAAASLRDEGFGGKLILIGDEPDAPYQRPPLSKAYLKEGRAALDLRAAAFFVDKGVDLRLGSHVRRIDRLARRIDSADGPTRYDHLILATGSAPRRLPLPGADLDGVVTLRTRRDADLLRDRAAIARSVVIVGAGFIGLEIAATLAAPGRSVAIFEAAPHALGRAVSRAIGDHLARAAEAAGVAFRFGAAIHGIEGAGGRAEALAFADGARIPADLIVMAVGARPNDALAVEAGLADGRGAPVDAGLLTADPAISAIGDVALHQNAWAGDRVRVESVQNAIDQAKCVAARLMGRPAPYAALPWFWSDQYHHKLQIAGLAAPADRTVVRPSETGLTVGRFRGDRLVAVETVDRASDHMAARRLLQAGTLITAAEFADPSFDLKSRPERTPA